MTRERLDLGARGEDAAARLFRRRGFRILHRNYTCSLGELDIVARKLDLLVFIEVKTRSSDDFAPPEARVDDDKQQRILRLADHYVRRFRLEHLPCRFDIVSVVADTPRRLRVHHIPDAFGARAEF